MTIIYVLAPFVSVDTKYDYPYEQTYFSSDKEKQIYHLMKDKEDLKNRLDAALKIIKENGSSQKTI